MPSFSRQLHPALAPLVAGCVGYDYRLPSDALHHGLPSTTATVVIAFDEPLDCGWFDSADPGREFWTLVSGLHQRPALIRTHGHQVGLQLALTPLGLRALFGVAAGECAHQILDESEAQLLPAGAHDLLQKASWRTRFDLIEKILLRRIRAVELRPEVAEAWRLLAGPSQLRVDDVARRVGWSRRHLQNRITAEFGLSPLQIRRVGRFERSNVLAGRGLPLAEVASRCGYADQAHLNREWRKFAAATPTETLAEFPIVQAELD